MNELKTGRDRGGLEVLEPNIIVSSQMIKLLGLLLPADGKTQERYQNASSAFSSEQRLPYFEHLLLAFFTHRYPFVLKITLQSMHYYSIFINSSLQGGWSTLKGHS